MDNDNFNKIVKRVRALVNIDFHENYNQNNYKEISLTNLRSLISDDDLHDMILGNLFDYLWGDEDKFNELTQDQKDQIFDLDIQRFNIRLNMIQSGQ